MVVTNHAVKRARERMTTPDGFLLLNDKIPDNKIRVFISKEIESRFGRNPPDAIYHMKEYGVKAVVEDGHVVTIKEINHV